jgi:uncharacterized membrane protein
MGPIEYLVVEFPGNKFKGEIIPALEDLAKNRVINVLDLVLIKKDQEGAVTYLELNDLDDAEAAQFDTIVDEVSGLLSTEDMKEIGAALSPNSSAGVLVFEDTWTERLLETIQRAEGSVLALDRIPLGALDDTARPDAQVAA